MDTYVSSLMFFLTITELMKMQDTTYTHTCLAYSSAMPLPTKSQTEKKAVELWQLGNAVSKNKEFWYTTITISHFSMKYKAEGEHESVYYITVKQHLIPYKTSPWQLFAHGNCSHCTGNNSKKAIFLENAMAFIKIIN